MWNILLHSCLIGQDVSQSLTDPCVYTRHTNDEITVIVVWVDDIIIATSCNYTLINVKKCLSHRFKMKDLGEIAWFIGI